MNYKILALALIFLLVIPAMAASNPKRLDRHGIPIVSEAPISATSSHKNVIAPVTVALTTAYTGGKATDIFRTIGQSLQLIPKDDEAISVTINDKIVAVIPTSSKFYGIDAHETCLTVYQYGTDGWYNCEMTEASVSPISKEMVVR